MKKRAWSDRMFEVTGIPRSIVPERLLESQQAAGCLLPELAERWGLRPGIPLAAAGTRNAFHRAGKLQGSAL